MENIKKISQLIFVSTLTLMLSGCFSKNDLKKPISDYLQTNYGINEGFKILDTDNNWFEGIDHQTYIEITKPYRSYAYLQIERDTLKILEDESDDLFLELFKGAYIEQHPEVVNEMKRVVKKYGFTEVQNKVVKDSGVTYFTYPYDNIELNLNYSNEMVDEFKKTQTINTNDLIPTFQPVDPRNTNDRFMGVINFLFEFDTNKNKHKVPEAKEIAAAFQKSGVLTKGIYNIEILVIDSSSDFSSKDELDTYALFKVDEKKNYTIIATPKYDDLDKADYYGDYLKKTQGN
ncbi:hypothetical protein [Bacillus sp. AFS088145]|uniref:hypothetical protein n=1 Tax=Bacillus sp. AFS088145 TaxID=2033514 RepID=UPI000BF2F795|nr:hypothetical protein [Bacillus sp. AFS088145]PFH88707.1 hypothetical protein COI44_08110 [Bacillus sp. AFS088145]